MGGVDHDKFAVLPALYSELMGRPLSPLVRGTLPHPEALYIFYREQVPITVGSLPYLNEMQWLAPSFRGGFSIKVTQSDLPPEPPASVKRLPATNPNSIPKPPHIEARWLVVEDATLRVGLEVFVSQKLDMEPTHPKIRQILGLND